MVNSVLLCFILAELPRSIAFITAPKAANPFISPTAIRTLLSITDNGGSRNAATIKITPIILKNQKKAFDYK